MIVPAKHLHLVRWLSIAVFEYQKVIVVLDGKLENKNSKKEC
jgi:hypothetical protein